LTSQNKFLPVCNARSTILYFFTSGKGCEYDEERDWEERYWEKEKWRKEGNLKFQWFLESTFSRETA